MNEENKIGTKESSDIIITKQEYEDLKRLAHAGLPSDCIYGWDEVKFCPCRQEDGNMCKNCSNYL